MSKTIEIGVKSDADKIAKQFISLKKEIKATEQSVQSLTKEFGENSSEATEATNKLNKLNTAYINISKSTTDLTANFEDMYGELQPLSSRLGELEDRMYELALAGKQNTQEFKDLQKEGARFRQTIIDVDKGVDLLAENRGLGVVAGGLGQIGDQLSSLDFEGASKTAKGLTDTIKGMDPKSVMAGFKALTSTIGQLGNAFFQMGLKLLANPIFLIVAVIAAVVIAIVLLKDKVKILEQAFDLIMIPIKALIQGLKDLSDWIGLTSFAEQDAAEKSFKAYEKRIEGQKRYEKFAEAAYQRELDLRKAQGEDTDKFEIKELKRKQSNSYKQFKDLENKIAAEKKIQEKGRTDISKEELAASKERLKKYQEDYDEQYTINLDSQYAIKTINAKNATEEREQIKKDNEKAKDDKEKADKDRLERQKAYDQKRLEISRLLRDMEIDAMEDGYQKELVKNQEIQDRKIQDVKRDATIEKDEKTKLYKAFEIEKANADKKAYNDEQLRLKAENDKEIADLIKAENDLKNIRKSFDDFIIENTGTELEKQLNASKNKFDKEKESLTEFYKDKLELADEYNAKIKELDRIAAEDQAKIKKENTDKKLLEDIEYVNKVIDSSQQLLSALNDMFNQADANRISQIESTNATQTSQLDSKLASDLAKAGNNEKAKAEIQKKYDKEKYKLDLEAFKKTEEIKKKEFQRNKAFRIVNAIIDTAQAVTASISASPLTGGLPFSAINAAIGAAQIAVIASQKYEGGTPPSAPTTSSSIASASSAGSGTSEATAPNVQLSGNANQGSEASDASAINNRFGNQTITVNAIVSETQITEVQNKIANIKQQAEL